MPTTTNYIWDEDNLLAEADGTNTIGTIYSNECHQYGNLVSARAAGTTSYHHFDALGSTRQLTNAVGHVTDSINYDAWGNGVSRTGSTSVKRLWGGEVGYFFDQEIDLVWVAVRPFSPRIARWASPDPLGLRAGINLYKYADNRPVSITDPSGREVYWNEYSRGNDDPGESVRETARITVYLDINTSGCGPYLLWCGCAGMAKVHIYYIAVSTSRNQMFQQIGPAFWLRDLGGSGDSNQLTLLDLDDEGVAVYGRLNLGTIPCSGGTKTGTVNVQPFFNGRWIAQAPDPNDQGRNPGMLNVIQQTITYSASIRRCGIPSGTITMVQNLVRIPTPLRRVGGTASGPIQEPYPPAGAE